MERNTYFIVSENKGKVTVMNRYTREAITRKVTKNKIVINREFYELEDMKQLTESMTKMKELEAQGCKPVRSNEVFFSTALRHDTHDLLFYLDMFGLVEVNGMPYSVTENQHADDKPVRKNTPLMGAVSTDGEVFFGDIEESLTSKILKVDFVCRNNRLRFESMEDLKQWVGEMISNHYDEIESTVSFGFFISPLNQNLILNFYYADEQGVGYRNRETYTLENIEQMRQVKPFNLQEWASHTSALASNKRPKRLTS